MQMGSPYSQSIPSSINFAPVITVVGNDNKGDIVSPTNDNTNNIPDFNGLVVKDSKENVESVNEDTKTNKNINDNAPQNIDFSNLVIKKSGS
jgi:hypothetical protein